MMVRVKGISTVLGVLALTALPALAQAPAAGRNQATADAVASAIGASKTLSGFRIEVGAKDGVVTLTGAVSNPIQKVEATERARRVAGVVAVQDQLVVADSRVRPAQYQMAMGHHGHGGGAPMIDGGMMGQPVASAPTMVGGPMPEGPAGMAGGAQASSPNLPNYAWPSYAPYPNYSAVGYPTAYPWQAWPNIGPFYPYPEVPLDWRAVTLRWDDGIWWLDFKKNYTRPFFTPYPFGIHAY